MTTTALKRLANHAGLDEHVLSTLMFRGWSVLAGGASIFLLPLWLSPTQQGFYYTFSSVLGLQIFFELGLSQVVTQLVSREIAHLSLTEANRRLAGDEARIGRLASLTQLLNKWYLVASVLFAIGCGVAGGLFLAHRNQLPWQQWIGVWIALVLCTAFNLTFSPKLALLEGTGQVGKVARLRFTQGVLGYVLLWLLLWLGGGLWVAMVIPFVSVITSWTWLRRNGQMLDWLGRLPFKREHRIAWRQNVLPFQWRIAVSWISGFFIFYLFTPLVFAQRGAVEAGRLGMAMTVFTSVSTVGMSWVNAKIPTFSMLISRHERLALNVLFKAVSLRSVAFVTVASSTIVLSAYALTALHVPFMTRIASPAVLALLGVVCVGNAMVFAGASYMRAHGEEPMLPQSVTMGLATAAIAYFGSRLGVLAMVAMYAALSLFVGLPWTIALLRTYYRRTR